MPMLGNIVVGLTATTGRFQRDMKKAGNTVKSFASSAASTVGKVTALSSAIMGLAGAGSLGMLMKSSMSSIDATAKLSDRLGIATEKLQGLRHAADITGAGAATMDASLSKMQKALGEAAQGIGEGKCALDALGMSLSDLTGKSPDQQFAMIADKVNGLASAEDRAFVATKLFGRSGQSLINTMALGSQGIAEMQAEAEKLGVAFSRVDAAKVEAANDALTRVGKVFEGIGNTLAIELSPYIESAATKFVELAGSGEGMGARISGGLRWVAESIAKAADFLNIFAAGFYTVQSGVNTLVAGALNGFDMIKAAGYSLSAVFGEAFGQVLKYIAKGVAKLEFEAKKIWNYWKRVTGQLSEYEEIKANNKARHERDARARQMESAGGNFSDQAKKNLGLAKAAFDSGLSGKAGAEWDKAAKTAANNAVASYDKFVNGSMEKQVSGFFNSIQNNAQKAAEQVAAKAAATNSPVAVTPVTGEKGTATPATTTGNGSTGTTPEPKATVEGSVHGSFSAASLAVGQGKIERDQLEIQKKMLVEMKRVAIGVTENDVYGIAG